jgi:hypothetical protein
MSIARESLLRGGGGGCNGAGGLPSPSQAARNNVKIKICRSFANAFMTHFQLLRQSGDFANLGKRSVAKWRK